MHLADRRFCNGTQAGAPFVLAGIMTLALVLLLIRSAGLYPAVMGDEYTYSTLSRLTPLSEASIPGYLYLVIYRLTSLCGSGYLMCSKLFNTLFFVAAAPFIHAVARRFCSKATALLIVALSLLGPVNSYTAYYMPEPLFFLAFWVSVWYFLRLTPQAPAVHWLLGGALLGGAALVKPHALLMIPGFCLCILFFAYKDTPQQWWHCALRNLALFTGALFACKFGISLLLAGKAGLTLFGSFYGSTLQSGTSTVQRYLDILQAMPGIIEGHVLANVLMFGAALAIIVFGSLKALASRTLHGDERIAAFTLILLLNLIGAVALFSATVAGTHVVETALRIHMRYYNFMLPLLFIAAGSQLQHVHTAPLRHWRLGVTVAVLSILAWAALTRMQPFTPSYIDSPELRGYLLDPGRALLLAGLCGVAVLLWYRSARLGAAFFVWLYLPLSIATSTAWNNTEVRERMNIDAYDRAGLFARSYLPATALSKLAVIGDGEALTLRTLMYLDNRQAIRDLSYVPATPYRAAQTPTGIEWVLAVGEVTFAEGEFEVIHLNGYALARKTSRPVP